MSVGAGTAARVPHVVEGDWVSAGEVNRSMCGQIVRHTGLKPLPSRNFE